MKCVVCGKRGERHHIKTRGSGGGDEAENILFLCRFHHSEWHQMGAFKFCQNYEKIGKLLKYMGWEFDKDRKLRRK